MNNKYFPVGTVCKIKDTEHKVMIVGYFYKNNSADKIYDYCACPHPEGLMANSSKYLFDHEQVEQVYALGYMNEAAIEYNYALKELISQNNQQTIPNLQFSPNGVVVADENEVFSTETAPKLRFNENGVVVADGDEILTIEPVQPQIETQPVIPQVQDIQFDVNGVVIEDKPINIVSGLQFNDAGVVIIDDNVPLPTIKFDANGVVISE